MKVTIEIEFTTAVEINKEVPDVKAISADVMSELIKSETTIVPYMFYDEGIVSVTVGSDAARADHKYWCRFSEIRDLKG